jgi:glycosyltransferase involved in cell wall biosynthesis
MQTIDRRASGLSLDFAGALRQIIGLKRAWQSRMRVVSGPEKSTQPTLYFLTPDNQRPSGGIRVIYRHVDILNEAGIDAVVLHQRRGFRCTWFDNQTRIIDAGNARVLRGDILVIPEISIGVIDSLAPGTRYVIFNQGVHLTWNGFADGVAKYYAPERGLLGVVTVSDHSQKMLNYAFEHLHVDRVHVGVDSGVFHSADGGRANRIAFMPRRMAEDAHQVFEILRGRGLLAGWEIVPLDRMTQNEVAAQLRTTKIFLALAYQEGFGLPPAEAMACGNYVIGYHGYGGKELFRPEFSSAVESGDIVGVTKAVESAIANETAQPGWCQAQGVKASEFIHSEYSLERENAEVTNIYAKFLKVQQSEP